MNRRTFLQSMAGAAAARAAAAQAGRIRLGFDSYSLRSFKWTAIEYLDHAAGLRLDTIQLSDLTDYASVEPAYLKKVKDHAERLGIVLEGGLGCMCPSAQNWRKANGDPFQYFVTGLRANHAAGARVMRVFMGGGSERRGPVPLAQHIETTLKILKSARSQALDLGVKIAIENHGDFQAWELRDLIEQAGKDYVGACLDTGNPISVVEDPLVTLETLGPYVLTTHIRDTAVWEHPRGAVTQSVALGDSSIDFPRFFARFRQLCPNVAVQPEVLTGGPPRVLPFLEPEFWAAFPKARASEFARFVALVKKGSPFMSSMVTAPQGKRPPEYEAALKEQQRIDLERSLDYAAKVLKLGIRRTA